MWYFLHVVFIEKEPEKKGKYFKFRQNNKILEKALMLLAELWEFN